jgi:hypothetical protein
MFLTYQAYQPILHDKRNGQLQKRNIKSGSLIGYLHPLILLLQALAFPLCGQCGIYILLFLAEFAPTLL